MKNLLIVHPEDPSTVFLKGIYSKHNDKTVISGGTTKARLRKLIENHKQVIMCGHGSPSGLFSVGQFPDSGLYIIDDSMLQSLRNKTNSIFIWCNADQFVSRHSLKGFCTGMFISELSEAIYFDFWDVNQQQIDASNFGFSSVFASHLDESLDILFRNVATGYGVLAKTNPIARYNFERLYFFQPEPAQRPYKVFNIQ